MEENVTITVNDGLAGSSAGLLIEIIGEKSKPTDKNSFQTLTIWIIILMIIIIHSVTGYAAGRKYNGNYTIEEIFCIYNNGILISHVIPHGSGHSRDEDLVSGMLTAIVNFTQEAFTANQENNKSAWGIKEIQMNEKNILVERGKYTFLATVFSGRSGTKLLKKSRRILEAIETKYAKPLESWKGSLHKVSGVDKIIKLKLSSEIKK